MCDLMSDTIIQQAVLFGRCRYRAGSDLWFTSSLTATTMHRQCPPTDAETYRDVMYHLGLGLALYEPEPSEYDHIRVGDVGYMQHGSFKRLYNACHGKHDKANTKSTLPQGFQPIEKRFCGVWTGLRLDWGIRKSQAVKESKTEGGAHASSPRYVQIHTWMHVYSLLFKCPSAPVKAGGKYSFTCHSSRGAVLATTAEAKRYHAKSPGAFEDHILSHSDALKRLVKTEKLGIKLTDVIVVTGCCLTVEGAIMVIDDSSGSASFGFQLGASEASIQGSMSKHWRSHTEVPLHKWGVPPPSEISHTGKPEPHDDTEYGAINGTHGTQKSTQCIFLQGYRAELRSLFPKKLKAAAGPHQLGKDQPPPQNAPAVSTECASKFAVSDDESCSELGDVRN